MYQIIDYDGNIISESQYKDVLETFLKITPQYVISYKGYQIIKKGEK